MASVKVLVFGSLNGALQLAFAKAASLHSKNNFSFAIVVGDLFGENGEAAARSLLNGDIKVPLPTYFTVGLAPLPTSIVAKIEADEDITDNLHFLGKRSTTKTTDGVRIVALGGQIDTEVMGGTSKEQHLPFHTAHDAKALKGAGKADILLTSVWPSDVWRRSNNTLAPEFQEAIPSTAEVAELCGALKPRYHFSPSPAEFFYEREPFVHTKSDDSDVPQVTRFLAMAAFGNSAKAKAVYAFTINLADTSVEQPANTTPSPFAIQAPKRRAEDDGSFSRFGNGDDRGRHHGKKRKNRHRSPPPGPDKCFFCLSNPNLSLHMICSIGEHSYLATAKGPLATPTTFADRGLTFPGHFIITPLAHTPVLTTPGESYSREDGQNSLSEMSRFRNALQAMVANRSEHKLGAVTWEISRSRNIHCHWQFHPVPADLVYNGLVEAGFKVEAENRKYPTFEERELSFEDQEKLGDYFRVWIWADNGEDRIKGQSLLMRLPDDPDSPRFDLQYPRRVIAKLLGLEGRFVWQDCAQTEEEEKEDVEQYRKAFKPWDFTQPTE